MFSSVLSCCGCIQKWRKPTYIHFMVPLPLRIRAEKYLDELHSMRIKLGSLIGVGSYGCVVKGSYKNSTTIAVKICSARVIERVREGIAIAREFKHDNIIGVINTLDKVDVLFVVMPFADTDLFEEIYTNGAFSQYDARIMCRQVLSGLQYMHINNCAHRDIKLQNILIFRDQNIYKICDLDSVRRVVDENGEPIEVADFGTSIFKPPELISDQTCFDPRAHDIWSFGIVAHTSVTYTYTFGRFSDTTYRISKVLGQMRNHIIEYPDGCDTIPEFEAFVRKCLAYDQTQRPTADHLLQNPWFAIDIPEKHDRFRVRRLHNGLARLWKSTSIESIDSQHIHSSRKCCLF